MTLPTDSKARKALPIATGVLDYFPDALAAVAEVSRVGNIKHNGPDAPLHWSRGKSADHADCIARHLLERGTLDDEDGLRHSAKLAWRALANLQIEIENDRIKAQGISDIIGVAPFIPFGEWIEWNGGDCPVPPTTRVEIELRNGYRDSDYDAGTWHWKHEGAQYGGDIVRYRVIPQK